MPLSQRKGETRLSFYCERCEKTFAIMAIPAKLYNSDMERFENLVAQSREAHVKSEHGAEIFGGAVGGGKTTEFKKEQERLAELERDQDAD